MTKFFLKHFIKDNKNAANPQVRAAIGRLSGGVGLVCNILLFAMKLAVGILSGSVSITADAMNNLSDSASAIVTLIGFKLAGKPADSEHPYGHARYEYLAGLVVAMLILFIGFELAKTSVQKILAPTPVTLSIPVGVVLLVSMAVKLWLCLFNRQLGSAIASSALLAVSTDSRNDVITTAAVLAAAVLEALTHWRIDGLMGLAVAVFSLYSGVRLARETVSPLLGEAATPQLRQDIAAIVTSDPRVLGYHDLMVHDYGPGQRFASIHVEMDQKEDPLLCHEIIDDLERLCLQKLSVHLVIHYDPVIVGDRELEQIRSRVCDILSGVDGRLTVHDFRMVKGTGHSNLIFDVTLPCDLQERQLSIKHELERALAAQNQGTYHTVITFDPEA